MVRSKLLTKERASTMGMYVPKSPTAPESSEKRLVLSLTEEGIHPLRRKLLLLDISSSPTDAIL